MEKTLKCNKNGEFTILVVSDPQCQMNCQWSESAMELETLVKKAEPDFVLINGDMETNNHVPKEAWDEFIKPLTKRGICWSTTNGNHDPFDEDIYKMYTSYTDCYNSLVSKDDEFYERERPLNYQIPIYSNDNKKIVFAIYGMDSGGLMEDLTCEGYTDKQIKWYRKKSDMLKKLNNGESVISLMCCHIPFAQVEQMEVLQGVKNEEITCTAREKDRGTVDAIIEQDDVKIAIFGHSHMINHVGKYKGLILGYAGKISSGDYHDEVSRGGRVVKINQSNPKGFTTSWLAAIPQSADQPEVSLK